MILEIPCVDFGVHESALRFVSVKQGKLMYTKIAVSREWVSTLTTGLKFFVLSFETDLGLCYSKTFVGREKLKIAKIKKASIAVQSCHYWE